MSNYLRWLSWWIFCDFSCWIFIFNSLSIASMTSTSLLSLLHVCYPILFTLARHTTPMCASLYSPSSISQLLGSSRCLFHLFHVYFQKNVYTNLLPMWLTAFLNWTFVHLFCKIDHHILPQSNDDIRFCTCAHLSFMASHPIISFNSSTMQDAEFGLKNLIVVLRFFHCNLTFNSIKKTSLWE